VVVYWGWSDNGWLAKEGYHDLGGSGIVHMLGGAAALVGAIAIGPRIGRFSTVDGKRVPNDINGHSMPLCVLGVFILWFGW